MNKKFSLLSGLLIASIISTSSINHFSFYANARNSRQVVVDNSNNSLISSSEKESSEDSTSSSKKPNSNINEGHPSKEETVNENSSTSETTSSDSSNLVYEESMTLDDIKNVSEITSHSPDFVNKFSKKYPELNPLRKLSKLSDSFENYLDVNSNSIQTIPSSNKSNSIPSVYSEQNICFLLLNEIKSSLTDINSKLTKENPSTALSLMPTILVFNDTYEILSLKYDSIVKDNFENQITLNIMLKDTQNKLSTLLNSINKFKDELSDIISESNNSSSDNEEVSNNENSTNTNLGENIDASQVILYFGDEGQEVILDEESGLYYQADPTNPENVIEYTGEVTQMTLEEYLDIDLFFDPNGNELLLDSETNNFFSLNLETGEFIPYDGDVIEMKMKDFIEKSLSNQ